MLNPLPRLPDFEYVRLDSIDATVHFLNQHKDEAHPFSGGTDTFIALRDRKLQPKYLVDLKHLPGLDTLTFNSEQGLTVGGAVTLNQLIAAADVQDHYPVISQAAGYVGGYQLRNRATLVGNLCNASPCGDTIGPSMIYRGQVNVIGPGRRRTLPLEKLFRGPGETTLMAGEIVQSITYPPPPVHNKGIYLPHGRNKLADLAMAAVTVLAHPDETSASGYRFRIALSAVSPTVIMVTAAQDLLSVTKINEKNLERAARLAMQSCKPIDDIRASKTYRLDMVYALTLRALRGVWNSLQSSLP